VAQSVHRRVVIGTVVEWWEKRQMSECQREGDRQRLRNGRRRPAWNVGDSMVGVPGVVARGSSVVGAACRMSNACTTSRLNCHQRQQNERRLGTERFTGRLRTVQVRQLEPPLLLPVAGSGITAAQNGRVRNRRTVHAPGECYTVQPPRNHKPHMNRMKGPKSSE